jgi:hypothetical protein
MWLAGIILARPAPSNSGKQLVNPLQRARRDGLERKLLIGIKTTLLSNASVESFKGKLMRALRKPGPIPSARACAPLPSWSAYGRRRRNWSACGSSRRSSIRASMRCRSAAEYCTGSPSILFTNVAAEPRTGRYSPMYRCTLRTDDACHSRPRGVVTCFKFR